MLRDIREYSKHYDLTRYYILGVYSFEDAGTADLYKKIVQKQLDNNQVEDEVNLPKTFCLESCYPILKHNLLKNKRIPFVKTRWDNKNADVEVEKMIKLERSARIRYNDEAMIGEGF